jgi:hypothetical protein
MNQLRDFVTGMDFGSGWNDGTGTVRNVGVSGSPPHSIGGDGQIIQFSIDKIETVDELHKALGISIDGSASFSLFGGSEKFKFAESCNVKTTSVFLVVSVSVTNSEQQMSNETLQSPGPELLAQGNAARFREEFGDYYVKGIQSGGEYFCVMEMTTESESDKTDVLNQLEAGGGVFGGASFDVKTQLTDTLNRISEKHAIHARSFQVGGADTNQPTDAAGAVDHAAQFAAKVREKSLPFRALIQDYQALNLPAPPNPEQLQRQKENLASIAATRAPLLTALNDLAFMIMNPGQFETPTINLSDLRNRVADAIGQLNNAASACMSNVNDCNPPHVDLPDLSHMPKRLDSPMVTNKDFTSRTWQFGRSDGSYIGRLLPLPDSSMTGYSHPNEHRWMIAQNSVFFLATDGTASTRFDSIQHRRGRWRLEGPFLLLPGPQNPLHHVLNEESGWPDGIVEGDLIGKQWAWTPGVFGAVNLTFMMDGRILMPPPANANLTFWTIDDAILLIRNDGVPSAQLAAVSRDRASGKRKLTGAYLPGFTQINSPFNSVATVSTTFELMEL